EELAAEATEPAVDAERDVIDDFVASEGEQEEPPPPARPSFIGRLRGFFKRPAPDQALELEPEVEVAAESEPEIAAETDTEPDVDEVSKAEAEAETLEAADEQTPAPEPVTPPAGFRFPWSRAREAAP